MTEAEQLEKALQGKFDALKTELSNGFATKEQIETAEKQIAEFQALKSTNEELNKRVSDMSETLKEMKDAQNVNIFTDNFEKDIEDFLTKNQDNFRQALKSGNGMFTLDKAVAIVTTANGTLPTALPANYVAYDRGVDNIPLRRPLVLDFVNKFNTNQVVLPYVEASPKEGDFAVVLEGGLKPDLDVKWETNYTTAEKYAGWIKVTEEVIADIPRFRDMVVNYLREKHDLFKEKQVFNYINTNSTAYVTGGALAGSVLMPTIMDVVNALQVQIINTPNYIDEPDFMADVVLLNMADFYKYFGAAKDAIGRPLFADGYRGSRTFRYNGYTFVATTLITAGQVIVMDSRKVDVTNYIPYNVSVGWVNDDFIKNQFVILGESRGHIYIRKHDKRAFVKGSISAIIADIEQPEVTP